MQITKLVPPRNGGVLWYVEAVSTRGRRWQVGLARNDRRSGAFIEGPWFSDKTIWHQVRAPKALMSAARKAIKAQLC
jgi:hypothetical protein